MTPIATSTSAIDEPTVKDLSTGLEWKCQTEGEHTFDDAVNRFGVANAEGWRLPTTDELKTLIVADDEVTVTLDKHKNVFWSSSPYVGVAGYAWFVFFSTGGVYGGDAFRGGSGYVRLVRAGQ
jgi:Protein of unknown function (DUF1566)